MVLSLNTMPEVMASHGDSDSLDAMEAAITKLTEQTETQNQQLAAIINYSTSRNYQLFSLLHLFKHKSIKLQSKRMQARSRNLKKSTNSTTQQQHPENPEFQVQNSTTKITIPDPKSTTRVIQLPINNYKDARTQFWQQQNEMMEQQKNLCQNPTIVYQRTASTPSISEAFINSDKKVRKIHIKTEMCGEEIEDEDSDLRNSIEQNVGSLTVDLLTTHGGAHNGTDIGASGAEIARSTPSEVPSELTTTAIGGGDSEASDDGDLSGSSDNEVARSAEDGAFAVREEEATSEGGAKYRSGASVKGEEEPRTNPHMVAAALNGGDLQTREFRHGLTVVAKPPPLLAAVFPWNRSTPEMEGLVPCDSGGGVPWKGTVVEDPRKRMEGAVGDASAAGVEVMCCCAGRKRKEARVGCSINGPEELYQAQLVQDIFFFFLVLKSS